MKAPEVRPRFSLHIDAEADVLMERLRGRLAQCPHCVGISVGRHAELFVPQPERHAWSPHLSVSAERDAAGGTVLTARFGPHPQLWTFYMFLAFGLAFGLLVGASWGFAQWAMDETPWALLSVPVVAILATLLYLASLLGQRLGSEQMAILRHGLDELIRSG